MPDLQGLSDSFGRSRFSVIEIPVDEDNHLMQEHLLQQKIELENYHDVNQTLAKDFLQTQAFPETFIVSADGMIVHRIAGKKSSDSAEVHRLLETIASTEAAVLPMRGGS